MTVPELRFPEFRDAGSWEEKCLIDLCDKITQGGTPDTSNQDYWNGSIEWLTPAEMGKTESRFIQSTARKITSLGLKNCSSELLPVNSLLISTRAPIGHLIINKSEMAINQGCKGLVLQKTTNTDFIYYSLSCLKRQLIDLGAGNTFKELTGSSLKNFLVPTPNFSEQQKIADCLSSVDELIIAQAQKIETLKVHKKGLMQQLFPAEGETVPRLRFSEFKDKSDWTERNIESVAEIKNGYTFRSAEYTLLGKYIIVTIANVQSGRMVLENPNKVFLIPLDLQAHQKLNIGDILISMTGNVGRVCRVVFENCLLNQRVGKLIPIAINNEFFYQLLQDDKFQQSMKGKAAGGAQGNLSSSSISLYIFQCPSSHFEQQKIATCLSSLDDLITLQTQKLETLKTHKKGLMQGLFPAADEVLA